MESLVTQLKTLALTDALPFFLKLGGAVFLWFVGRAVINGFRRVLNLALHRRGLDDTLIRYTESLFTGAFTILLLLGLLGMMGIETTSFAALLAAAGIAIGSAWSGLLVWCAPAHANAVQDGLCLAVQEALMIAGYHLPAQAGLSLAKVG